MACHRPMPSYYKHRAIHHPWMWMGKNVKCLKFVNLYVLFTLVLVITQTPLLHLLRPILNVGLTMVQLSLRVNWRCVLLLKNPIFNGLCLFHSLVSGLRHYVISNPLLILLLLMKIMVHLTMVEKKRLVFGDLGHLVRGLCRGIKNKTGIKYGKMLRQVKLRIFLLIFVFVVTIRLNVLRKIICVSMVNTLMLKVFGFMVSPVQVSLPQLVI